MNMNEYEHGASRSTDPMTSKKAAESVDATKLEKMVLEAVKRSGEKGMTCEEVADKIEMEVVSVSPRFAPLKRKGLIYRTDLRRAGKSGRGRIIWKA